MANVAIILADGFEEIEALTPVDVLRRAEISCEILGLTSQQVTGSHGIQVQADSLFTGDLSAYDMIVLPGGLGATGLCEHEGLRVVLQEAAKRNAYLAAICAAPLVLEQAGLLAGKRYTCFPGVEKEIVSGEHQTDVVVVDGKLITSRGAGTSLAFAYQLVDCLGGDGQALAERMVYTSLFE